jgi:hypothetical protein
MAKQSGVRLPDDERAPRLTLTTRGNVSARRLMRAHWWRQAEAG